MTSIKANLYKLREEIEALSNQYQKPFPRIVAVSKTHSVEKILEAYQAGQRDFGENKVQELIQKAPLLPNDIRWHLIGHLQTNKVKYIASFIHLIHSVDSEKLLSEIQKQAERINRKISVLFQINISNEPQKSGFSYSDAEKVLQQTHLYPNIVIKGFMGIAEHTPNTEIIYKQFNKLYRFLEYCKIKEFTQAEIEELSIGMSEDYAIAIQCNSTILRIGSAIFGNRDYQQKS